MAIGDLMGMMKQAKQLQEKMQSRPGGDRRHVGATASPGGGSSPSPPTARATSSASASTRRSLKPEEVEILEDLIVAAMSDARGKAETLVAEKMQAMTGGLNLPPGMKLPF